MHGDHVKNEIVNGTVTPTNDYIKTLLSSHYTKRSVENKKKPIATDLSDLCGSKTGIYAVMCDFKLTLAVFNRRNVFGNTVT